jgi:heme oxygenase (biliverdin-IX-beta and delta-forming)
MLLQRLREETRSAHEAIERGLETSRAYVSIPHYRLLVARFFGFYAEWEPRVAATLGDEAFFAPRRKLHLLKQDLGHLGFGSAAIQGLPHCPSLPPLRDLAESMGSLYVLEGSTLGGQVVSRHLERSLGLTADNGYAFFRSYGREIGPMWRAFGERLLSTSSKATEDAIVRSAQITFGRLHSWLCHGL